MKSLNHGLQANHSVKTFKSCAGIFGGLLFSTLLILVPGGYVRYTTDGTTVDGPFSPLVPASADNPLSVLGVIGHLLGLGDSGALLLTCVSFGLSLIAGLILIFGTKSSVLCQSPFRLLVISAYCATPLLATVVVGMFLYAAFCWGPTA